MIPFASQRGGGQDLATHLMNEYDNENAEVEQIRGAIAGDLHGAFKEWEVQARALTRCEKYLYSLSINPDPAQGPLTRAQYMDYIARAEDALGLEDQPRAVVFHTKFGREHCHVVWSRINADERRAVHLAFDREKLMRVTRSFARDHDLALPAGYDKSRQVGQMSLYEMDQMRQTGLSKADHMRQVTEAWHHSDDARAFMQALAERGYMLATGKRPYLLVDLYGNVNALPKLIDDKTVRTKDIRAFLGAEFPPESLPSVEEAEKLVAAHRKQVERSLSEDRYACDLAALKHQQQERRKPLECEREELGARQQQARLDQQRSHRLQREALRQNYRQAVKTIRADRDQARPTGLSAFLGKVTGVERIRNAWHRYEDRQRLKAYRAQREIVKEQQDKETRALALRLDIQKHDLERRQAALEKVDRRELAAFMRDQRAEQRIRNRGEDGTMPSLVVLVEPARKNDAVTLDLSAGFMKATEARHTDIPDLLAAFGRAARGRTRSGEREESGTGLENARPPDVHTPDGPGRGR